LHYILLFCLRCLLKQQREVLLMVGLEDMSYIEVSQSLDIPVGTVMSRLSRGRGRLRTLMMGSPVGARDPVRKANALGISIPVR
jgi:RNA polymerase sigma-70 factor (ECF subfamily)